MLNRESELYEEATALGSSIKGRQLKDWSAFKRFYHPTKNTVPYEKTVANERYWWLCEQGHETFRKANAVRRGEKCFLCLRLAPPEFEHLYHPTKNTVPYSQTAARGRYWWRCEQGHAWEAVAGAIRRNQGCPYCANRRVLVGFNDLASCYPKIAAQWHPRNLFSAVDVVWGSEQRVWWLCERGHEWTQIIRTRVLDKRRCPNCRDYNSSKIEERLAENLKAHYPKLTRAYVSDIAMVSLGKHASADMLAEDKVILEYDGAYWHAEAASYERDQRKTRNFLAAGYSVVRLREVGLASLGITDARYAEKTVPRFYKAGNDQLCLQAALAGLAEVK